MFYEVVRTFITSFFVIAMFIVAFSQGFHCLLAEQVNEESLVFTLTYKANIYRVSTLLVDLG